MSHENIKTDEANASLISAAPELLSILEAIEVETRRIFPGFNSSDLMVEARAAIAKAKGITYPITITEIPHRGDTRTWTLESEDHLARCIEQAERTGSYTDWQIQAGNLVYEYGTDGEEIEKHNEAYTLDAYLEWLGHDLRRLVIEH
jgi:hypothetical protein